MIDEIDNSSESSDPDEEEVKQQPGFVRTKTSNALNVRGETLCSVDRLEDVSEDSFTHSAGEGNEEGTKEI